MDSEYIDLKVVTEFVVLRIRLILKWLLVTVDNWFLSDKIKVVSGQNNLFQYDYRWIFF
jgi:DNA-binding cell septation regulator SpoVG